MKSYIAFFFLVLFSSCEKFQSERNFDKTSFELSGNCNQLVCFDLTNDENPSGGLLVRSSPEAINHNILLPFSTKGVDNSEDILSTSANYRDLTIIEYKGSIRSEISSTFIIFTPIFSERESEVDELSKGIYLIRSGLERRFVYNIGLSTKYTDKYKSVSFDSLKSVAIKLPKFSKGLEIENGHTSKPNSKFEKDQTKYFELSPDEAKDKIVVSYLLPASKKQIAFFELLMKLLILSLVPLIQFVFIKPSKVLSPQKKKIITWVSVIIEGIMLLILAYLALTSSSIDSGKTIDFILLAAGAVITFFLVYYKESEPKEK